MIEVMAADDPSQLRLRAVLTGLVRDEFDGSQSKAAKALGVTQELISGMMAGKRPVAFKTIQGIVAHTGRSYDEVLGNSGPRWRGTPGWAEAVAEARRAFPRVSDLAWTRLGNLMGERPPPLEPGVLGVMAAAWDQASTDAERAEAIAANAEREMAEEDAQMDALLRRRHEAERRGTPKPALPDEPTAPAQRKARRKS